jgi:hypothetical protein
LELLEKKNTMAYFDFSPEISWTISEKLK